MQPLHDGTEFDLESKQPRRHPEFPDPDKNLQNYTISSLWMYDWMQELKDFHNWKKAVRDDDDVHVFAFRESKIYILIAEGESIGYPNLRTRCWHGGCTHWGSRRAAQSRRRSCATARQAGGTGPSGACAATPASSPAASVQPRNETFGCAPAAHRQQ